MNRIILMFLLAAGIVACESETGEKTTPSGFTYTVIEKSDAEAALDGQYFVLNLMYKDQKDSVWVNTVEMGRPSVVIKQDSVWKENKMPLEEMLLNAGKGDSLKITLTAEELFKGGQMPPNIQPQDQFTIFVGVAEVLSQDELQTWQQDFSAKQQAQAEQKREEQLVIDKEKLEEFFTQNNINAQSTESGLRYVIHQEGTGDEANAGDQVRVNYTGQVLGGEYFDSSIETVAQEKGFFNEAREYGPFTFTLGQGQVIQGWDEGIDLLKEGGKATLYIPSSLAYGPRQRSPEIGPNAILVFDVELVEVVENENQ